MSETTPSAAVDPTDEAGVTAAVEHALREIEAAADLSELKTVRLAHTGEKSPLALAVFTNTTVREESASRRGAKSAAVMSGPRRLNRDSPCWALPWPSTS